MSNGQQIKDDPNTAVEQEEQDESKKNRILHKMAGRTGPQVSVKPKLLITEKPWAGKEHEWHWFRLLISRVVHNRRFDMTMGAFIIFNLVVIIYEADYEAQCYPAYFDRPNDCPFRASTLPWCKITNTCLLCLYSVEGLLRLYSDRVAYFKSPWNQLDMLVVGVGWFGEVGGVVSSVTNLGFLRIVRITRLIRAFRSLVSIRELYLLLNGMLSSVRSIFFGSMMLITVLLSYSILVVEWVHPSNTQIVYRNCPECSQSFNSVAQTLVTLFGQLIAGDSWIISFQLFGKRWWIAPMMITMVVTIILGILNLILTVIVERAAEAREKDAADIAHQKRQLHKDIKKKLYHLCQIMDEDGNGTLTMDELLDAFRESEEFRNFMMGMDVNETELMAIFQMLDVDGSGTLDYEEFCNELVQLESQDQRMMVTLTRYSVQEVRTKIERSLEPLIRKIASSIETHQERFDNIESKLDKLLCAFPSRSLPPEPAISLPGHPFANDGAQCTVTNMKKLHHEMQNQAFLHSDLAREVDEQVSTLLCHAEGVALIAEALGREDVQHPCEKNTKDNSLLGQCRHELESGIDDLHQNVCDGFASCSMEVKKKLLDASNTLNRNRQMLENLLNLLASSCGHKFVDYKDVLDRNMAPISRM